MSLYDIPLTTIDGETITLDAYRGKMLLIVNVASRCGFTPQYKGLEALYRESPAIISLCWAFRAINSARRSLGSEAEIRDFCSEHYDVTFPLFAKIDVNGPNTHPLYRHLKSAKRGFLGREAISWNFTKFLVGKDGTVLRRYAPRLQPKRSRRI